MSMCTPACWCLPLSSWHVLSFAERKIMSTGSIELKWSLLPSQWKQPSTHVFLQTSQPLNFVDNLFPLHSEALWMWASSLLYRCTAGVGAPEAAEGDSLTQWCSQSWVKVLGGDPCGAAPPTVREAAAASSSYWFTLQPWACCHRQYISLYLIHC